MNFLKQPSFVGRSIELAALSQVLDDVRQGTGRIVVVAGSAGIGKSRLVREFVSKLNNRDAEIVYGRSAPSSIEIPFFPWREVLKALQSATGSALFPRFDHNELSHLQDLTLGKEGSPGESNHSQASVEAQHLLFELVTDTLKDAATKVRPVAVVLEDIQDFDVSSLDLLSWVADGLSRVPVLLICTLRESAATVNKELSITVDRLMRSAGAGWVQLQPLPRNEAKEMVSSATSSFSIPDIDAVEDRLVAIAEGNPFYLWQLLLALSMSDDGLSRAFQANRTLLPSRSQPLGHLLDGRFASLNEPTRRLLYEAAVLGHEFDAQMLALVSSGDPKASVREMLDVAVRQGLISRTSESQSRYRFAHALLREYAERRLPPNDEEQLHLRVAEELTKRDDESKPLVEIGNHYVKSGKFADPNVAGSAALAAARHARHEKAYIEAADLFGQAARLLAPDGEYDMHVADANAGQALCLVASGRPYLAVEPFFAAAEQYLELGKVNSALDLATSESFNFYESRRYRDLLQRCTEFTVAEDETAALLLSKLALGQTATGGDLRSAEPMFEEALKRAEKSGHITAEAWVYCRWSNAQGENDASRVQIARSAVAAAYQSDSIPLKINASVLLASGLLRVGELDEATANAREAFRLATSGRDFFRLWQTANLLSLCLRYAGDLESAGAVWQEAERTSHGRVIFHPPIQNALYAFAMGDQDKAKSEFQRALEHYRSEMELQYQDGEGDVVRRITLSMHAALLRDVTRDRSEFDKLLRPQDMPVLRSDIETGLGKNLSWPDRAFLLSAAIFAIQDQDRKMASVVLQLLGNGRHTWMVNHGHLFGGSVDRLKGRLALTARDKTAARRHLTEAVARCEQTGFWVDLILSICDLAELLHSDGSVDEAVRLIEKAERHAETIAIQHLSNRLENVNSALIGSIGSQDAYGLTARELEVLRLIETGKTDRQIAVSLHISVYTAGDHVKNILRKLGATNRVEVAAMAARQRSEFER